MEDKKILNILGNMIFYIVLISLLSISLIMVKSQKDGKQPSIMGNKFFTVMTGSMEPTIMVGDLVVAKEVQPEQIKVGDIITFKGETSQNITTHRVKEVLNDGITIKYITQGDANNTKDPNPVKSNLLIGKIVKRIPKIGSLMNFMKENLQIIVVIIFAVVLLNFIVKNTKKKLDEIDKEENKKKSNI